MGKHHPDLNPQRRVYTLIAIVLWLTSLFTLYYSMLPNEDEILFPKKSGFMFKCPITGPEQFQFWAQENMDIDLEKMIFNFEEGKALCGTGVFVDIGANDGKTSSNSKFFEESLGWRGVCVDPNPEVFNELTRNRPLCNNFNVGIAGSNGVMKYMKITGYAQMLSGWVDFMTEGHLRRIDQEIAQFGGDKTIIDVRSSTLMSIMELTGYETVDFLSVDVEGAELEVLKSIDFSRVKTHVVVVEANEGEEDRNQMVIEYMEKNGFVLQKLNRFNNLFVNPLYKKLHVKRW
eukprot:TRINITY_DN721_c0_g1_i1.p1 TRINITY_DN721_c0_g1~~TRINITY_DN721_c0_g1_i1.p1  ORF type:complete len:289 (-),score=52.96 TRINITY_DN721_c0_g1_i1:71-937(-)